MKHTIAAWKILSLLTFIVGAVVMHRVWITTQVSETVVLQPNDDPISLTPISTHYKQVAPLQPVDEIADSTEEITKLSNELLEKLELEPDQPEHMYYATLAPNDPEYPQWYTDEINAPLGWDVTTGSADVTVAVIDTGYALQHEDLQAAWAINAGETGTTSLLDTCWTGLPADKATNNCDDDNNGYIDDVNGWDFANADNNAEAGDNSLDGANHGTKAAGLVGARSNNGLGVASINWGVKLMPLQGLADEGYGFSSEIGEAVVYAVDNGASVINMSLGGPSPDSIIYAAIKYATDRGVIVVASAGNCGAEQISSQCNGYPSPGGMGYPARYPETIAVGATDQNNNRASFSSYGPELDLVAPGSGSIRTPNWTTSNATTAYSSSSYGTSFSAPIVAGMVGLLKSEFPELTKDEAVAMLKAGTTTVAGMNNENRTDEYGFGLLNVRSTLDQITIYQSQLEKASDSSLAITGAETKPLVSTNSGHSSLSPITQNDPATSYCVTIPNTDCQLTLFNPSTGQTVQFDAVKTNAQGIASWVFDRFDVSSSGQWQVTASANGASSNTEQLYIQFN